MATDSPVFGRIALIGIGLIGSSLARAIKRHGGLCRELVACDASEEALRTAFNLGIVDQTFRDPAAAARGADLRRRGLLCIVNVVTAISASSEVES